MQITLTRIMLGLTLLSVAAVSMEAAPKTPWWKEQKIVFMWGQWSHAYAGNPRQLPRERFRDIAQAGATVFIEGHGAEVFPDHARLAHEFGMRYFANVNMCNLMDTHSVPWVRDWNGRKAVTKTGEASPPNRPWCPLHRPTYWKLLVEPHLEIARAGLLDGIHIDWEEYGGKIGDTEYETRGEAGICYCDDCFSAFMSKKGIDGSLPAAGERFGWLENRKLEAKYEQNYHQRRVEMFSSLAKQLREFNPQLLFSVYYGPGEINDFSQAMHTPDTPFIYLDQMHYNLDDRMAWWETYSARLKQEGYLYVPCSIYEKVFNGQGTVQVSASRWLYEAAINEDGVVIWYGREMDDEILRTYGSATRQIKAVERKVGEYLLSGELDHDFVTAVEWTGRPELEQAIVARTYHLGGSHLAHLNNVHTDWPVRVRVRFPRLTAGKRWTVQDPINELYYTRDGKSSSWTSEELRAGVAVAMDTRSDIFMLISPASKSLKLKPSQMVYSQDYTALPEHEIACEQAVSIKQIGDVVSQGDSGQTGRLVYTSTEPMGFGGYSGHTTIGNTIRTMSIDGANVVQFRQLRGHLWSPRYTSNGNRIAFVHDACGRGQIYVMNSDSSEALNISKNKFCDRLPVWSPDGSKIAFLSDREGDWDIYVMNADGSEQRRLAGNPGMDRAPAWSPDGTHLAWESHVSGTPTIWVCDAEGQHSRRLIAADRTCRVQGMQDGKIADLKNEAFARTTVFPDNTFYLMEPVWSPDGTRIAAKGLIGSYFRIVVLEADGSRMLDVASYGCGDLVWSPDGKQLAGTRSTIPWYDDVTGIFIVNADGTGNFRWLVEGRPQGPRMAQPAPHPSTRHSWYSHGSAQPRMVAKSFCSLTWSPDGKTLTFSSDMDPKGQFYLYTISPDGGVPTRLDATRSAWPQQVGWMLQ